ncbi:MAG: hypothetical protein IJ658_00795 [Kiritimatiellae bacterium]|nr:hypothetical protein [Kiritimatiellia bacterium]
MKSRHAKSQGHEKSQGSHRRVNPWRNRQHRDHRRFPGPHDKAEPGCFQEASFPLPRRAPHGWNARLSPCAIFGFIDNSKQLANIMLCDTILRDASVFPFKTWDFTTSQKKREKDVLNLDGFIYQLSTSGKYHIGVFAHGLFFHFLPSGGKHAPERGSLFPLNWIFGPAHVDIVVDFVTSGRPAT